MNFALRFPEGWRPMNTREAVGAFEPKGDAFVAMRVAGPGDDPRAAAQQFRAGRAQAGARETSSASRRFQVGEFPAYRMEVEAGAIKSGAFVTFVAYEGLVFRFDTVARAADIGKFEGRGPCPW